MIEQKRTLFAGCSTATADEVGFAALGQQAFLDTVRELLEGEPPTATPNAEEARAKLVTAGVQFLEALAALLTAEKPAVPADLARRGTAALRAILGSLDGGEAVE